MVSKIRMRKEQCVAIRHACEARRPSLGISSLESGVRTWVSVSEMFWNCPPCTPDTTPHDR